MGHSGDNNNNLEPESFRQERHADLPGGTGELFDLSRDPQQTTNLYSTRPKIVAQLKQELELIKAGKSAAGLERQ